MEGRSGGPEKASSASARSDAGHGRSSRGRRRQAMISFENAESTVRALRSRGGMSSAHIFRMASTARPSNSGAPVHIS